MDYKGFQRFIFISGSLLILVSTALVFVTTRNIQEVVGQLLFFLLLAGGVYYGLRGGIVAAILASTVYAALQFPTILSLNISAVLPLILIRAAIYGITGPLGGEILAKIKQFMIEASHQEYVDEETKIFNKVYFIKLAEIELAKFERYNTVASLVVVNLNPKAVEMYLESPQSPGIKYIADAITSNVRLVDEVGRIDNHTFAVILPFTSADGAGVVAKRLLTVTENKLGYTNSVSCDVIALPDDKAKLEGIIKDYSEAA